MNSQLELINRQQEIIKLLCHRVDLLTFHLQKVVDRDSRMILDHYNSMDYRFDKIINK